MNDLGKILQKAAAGHRPSALPAVGPHRSGGLEIAGFQGTLSLGSGAGDSDASGPDPRQFLRLFLENERRIYGFIVSILPNLSDAEDVLQETSLILWQKFGQFELGTDFVAWACRVAQFRVLKFYEKQGRSKLQFDAAALEAVANEAIGMAPLLEDRHHALAKCLEALNPRDRDLLHRRYADDATPQQISSQVGRSIHAVYKALSRIHDGLMLCVQQRLQKEWKE